MDLVNMYTLPGMARASGAFGDFPRFPELPEIGSGFETAPEEAAAAAGSHFAEILENAVDAVNQQKIKADDLAAAFATGADVDTHQVMIETARAETMVHLTSSVATKMAQNVQTIMNMQI